MARFLLACYPISGHLHPNIAVAHALRERGHEVAIYSGEMARATVEGEGFAFFPYHPEMDERLRRILLPDRPSTFASDLSVNRAPLTRLRQLKANLREWFLSTVPHQVEDLEAAIDRWHPDVLVTDISLFGPILVLHETQPIPVAAFCVLPACPLPGRDAPTWGRGLPPPRNWYARLRSDLERVVQDWVLADFRAEVNSLRLRYGLKPLSCSVMAFSGQLPLFLVAGAPEFDYNRRDLPPSVHYVGPCLWHRPQREPPPAWLAELPRDRPVVHVTEVTIHVRQPVVLRAAAQGLGHTEMEVIMTTGKHRDPASLDLGPLAPNIRVERYVPHGDLFPRTDVVVTTGGAGTVLTALSAGVPLVVIPTGWDLPENAQRVVEAGVGVRLHPKDCTPKKLRAAVERVLGDPSYRRNAERIGAALARRGGAPRAAELLETLVNTPGKPPQGGTEVNPIEISS